MGTHSKGSRNMLKRKIEGLRDGTVAKNTNCSFTGPRFGS